MMSSENLAMLGIGYVIGTALTAWAYRRSRRSLASFWKRAYDNELKRHAETKEAVDATYRNIAAECSKRNLTFQVNGKTIGSPPEAEKEDAEWPSLIGEK